tara:strand:- start:76 stop:294 length:219 start_codon:yes stop_codon:yes gene_type:complete
VDQGVIEEHGVFSQYWMDSNGDGTRGESLSLAHFQFMWRDFKMRIAQPIGFNLKPNYAHAREVWEKWSFFDI